MRIKAIPLLIALMAIALCGIVVIQYRWIRKSIHEKQALIDHKVLQAITNVDVQLTNTDALAFFADHASPHIKPDDSLLLKELTDTAIRLNAGRDTGQQNIELRIFSSHYLSPDSSERMTHHKMHQRLTEMDCIRVELHQVEAELQRLHEVQSVFDRIRVEVNPLLADSRLDSSRIATLLDKELKSFDLGPASDWGIFDAMDNRYTIHPQGTGEPDYRVPLFKNDIVYPQRYSLVLTMEKANGRIWADIRWMIVLSLLFILIILSVFVFSIRLVVKHKKISQIKSDFINNMTHEFKTPLASISLAADSILHPQVIADQKQISDYVRVIQQEKTRLNQNVERILEVAALEKGAFELPEDRVDIAQCVRNAIQNLQLLLEERAGTIQFDCAAQAISHGSIFHLQNAVSNLIENAIKYSKRSPVIYIQLNRDGQEIRLTVRDNGIGMTPQQTAHVFDNFYRAQTGNIHTTKGFGLGLTYSKLIIEKMGGQIAIDSELKKGTVVTIKLPCHD